MSEISKVKDHPRIPEARYAYYRRCQVFRRNGVQCKAPAEKGAQICHAHAGQLAMAVRRKRERRAVLMEAVAEMRKRGKPQCEMADLFTDFKGIQVTLAVMSRAVIKGTIDCKTAGQMVVQLQTFSKLLWQIHGQERKGRKDLPLIGADNADLKKLPNLKPLPRINADDADLKKLPKPGALPRNNQDGAGRKKLHVGENLDVTFSKHRPAFAPLDGCPRILPFKVLAFGDRCRAHGPPESEAA